MKILVTAGNTLVPIDRVRAITNVFSGRTGAGIASHALERGHQVTLLTSHPEVTSTPNLDKSRWQCLPYRTFADLHALLAEHVSLGGFHAVVHCAAVSDYESAGIYAPAPDTRFETQTQAWLTDGQAPTLLDRQQAKVKSNEPELWLRLVRTSKLVDRMRRDWGFRGILVKFKLEVDISVERLLTIAEASRRQSDADWMVANILTDQLSPAYLGPFPSGYEAIARVDLPRRLLDVLESAEIQDG